MWFAKKRYVVPAADWKNEPDLNAFGEASDLCEIDAREAIRRLTALAGRGSIQSMIQIAYMYQIGKGVDKDLGKAEDWLVRAAKLGSNDAGYRLGQLYRDEGRFT